MATFSFRSESKRRRRPSGVVRSLPSSTSSPLSRCRGRTDNCTGLRDPVRPSSLYFRCYHRSWVDPPSWAARARSYLQTLREGTARGLALLISSGVVHGEERKGDRLLGGFL